MNNVVTITFFVLTLLMGLLCTVMKVNVPDQPVTKFIGNLLFKLGGLFVIFYSGVTLCKYIGLL